MFCLTDSNYGNIFSIWTGFGTFMTLPKEEIIYGIDTYPDPEDHNELKFVKYPFKNHL
jgi:sterol desaturase/sphingolipid hydroxylase (fatty acid hydroxylase superfamily)